MLFSGLFIKNSRIPAYFFWLKYLSWFYYATENMFIGQWAFEKTFYCSPIGDATREKAEFAEIAQIFERSDYDCSFTGKNKTNCYYNSPYV